MKMPAIRFTVDSALLRELGERLVGRAHVALAELIKNAYDADARNVTIRFGDDRIEVADNGHGMTRQEFKDFWMRIGSPHKQQQKVSRKLGRPLTGSKGIGRLAVQFLARRLELRTVPMGNQSTELVATVNWDKAVAAGDLTQATAQWRKVKASRTYPGDSSHGMSIVLSRLNHDWNEKMIADLAEEVWMLQPPFGSEPGGRRRKLARQAFEINVESARPEEVDAFKSRMNAVFSLWYARASGRLVVDYSKDPPEGLVSVVLEFEDVKPIVDEFPLHNCKLEMLSFEIRVFHLRYRQPYGIRVGEARKYLNKYGGVHLYDAGFRLPYYGVDTDWLDIEKDHSHRLSKSKLLPEELHVPGLMTNLPTNTRLYGIVRVDTTGDRHSRAAHGLSDEEVLKLSVTRDRLVANQPYEQLKEAARRALDFYALHETKRKHLEAEKLRPVEPVSRQVRQVEKVLEEVRTEIPSPTYRRLEKAVRDVAKATISEQTHLQRKAGLLGALATAGMTALAMQHEMTRQTAPLRDMAERLRGLSRGGKGRASEIGKIADRIDQWLKRTEAMRALFTPLLDEENRERRSRLRAKSLVEDVRQQLGPLARGVTIDNAEMDPNLRLPQGSYAEWSALFQNVFVNAINATLEAPKRLISVSTTSSRGRKAVLVQDTGCGVDLEDSERLFDPFVRKLEISPDRRSLGLGGTGLGLTIVRMIAETTNCDVAFVEPGKGFNTAFRLCWRE
jgi:signal transduction histidine kinase